MSDIVKEWLKNLYTKELEQERCNLANERLCVNECSNDDDEILMYKKSIAHHREYIDILKKLIEEL